MPEISDPFPRLLVRTQAPGDKICVACAFGTALDLRRDAPFPSPRISVGHIWAEMNETPSPADGVRAVENGVADEGWWPPGALAPPPPPPARFQATTEQPSAVDLNDLVKQMCDAIDARKPVVTFIPLFKNFEKYDGAGPFVPKGKSSGAHALCIVGYESPPSGGGTWRAVNSWGEQWGAAGYCQLPWLNPSLAVEENAVIVTDVQPMP